MSRIRTKTWVGKWGNIWDFTQWGLNTMTFIYFLFSFYMYVYLSLTIFLISCILSLCLFNQFFSFHLLLLLPYIFWCFSLFIISSFIVAFIFSHFVIFPIVLFHFSFRLSQNHAFFSILVLLFITYCQFKPKKHLVHQKSGLHFINFRWWLEKKTFTTYST